MKDKLVRTTDCRMRFQLSMAIVSLLTLLPVVGFAAGNKSQQSKNGATITDDNFARADENHDGKLSRAEAGDFLVYEVFTACDLNHDGKISLQEWLRVKPGQTAAFEDRDANNDGFVTLEEAIVYGRRGGAGLTLLKQADTNHDGKIDRAELQAYLNKH